MKRSYHFNTVVNQVCQQTMNSHWSILLQKKLSRFKYPSHLSAVLCEK